MIRQLLSSLKNSEKIAVMEGDKLISYSELAVKVASLRQRLVREQPELVAIFLPNGSDFISAFLGVILSGYTAFPLNIMLTKFEIFPLLDQTSAEIVITSKVYSAIWEEIKSDKMPFVHIVYIDEVTESQSKDGLLQVDVDINKPITLLTTSGSTGKAKIVKLSDNNMSASVLGYMDKMKFINMDSDKIRYVIATPFSCAYGLMILLVCIINKFPIVMSKECFTLEGFYKTVQVNKVTHYEGGALITFLMEQTAGKKIPYDISSLKHIGFGGSKVSGSTLRVLYDTYSDMEFWQGYGMTEASPLITKYNNVSNLKLESVGTAIKGVQIAVEVNGMITDNPYTEGEIVVSGANVMLGYYENQLETNEIIKNGYLYTGDIGYLDEEGYLFICGRKKNIIIVRGLNVHPEELEACILNSLLAKDCIVYGESDKFGNEIICADIIPINQAVHVEEIMSYCIKHLSNYKQPHKIRFVSEINKTTSGKNERWKG